MLDIIKFLNKLKRKIPLTKAFHVEREKRVIETKLKIFKGLTRSNIEEQKKKYFNESTN